MAPENENTDGESPTPTDPQSNPERVSILKGEKSDQTELLPKVSDGEAGNPEAGNPEAVAEVVNEAEADAGNEAGPADDAEAEGDVDAQGPAEEGGQPDADTPDADVEETTVLAPTEDAEVTTVLAATTDAEETTVLAPTTGGEQAEVEELAAAEEPVTTVQEPAAAPSAAPAAAPAPAPTPAQGPELDSLGIGVPEKKRSKKALWATLGVIGALAAGYVGLAFYCADRVPTNTTVAGVDISGKTKAGAISALQTSLEPITTQPIPVTLGENDGSLDPIAAGLAFDAAATVEPLVSFSLDPRILWAHLAGYGEATPVTTIDQTQLLAELSAVNEDLQVNAVDGEITLSGTQINVTEPVLGVSLDAESAAQLVSEQWLVGARPIVLPTEDSEPPINRGVIDQIIAEKIEPLLAGPITLTSDVGNGSLVAQDLAELLVLEPADGTIDVSLDTDALHELLVAKFPDLEKEPTDARIILKDGKPAIVEHVNGQTLDSQVLSEELLGTITASATTRELAVAVVETEPEFTTAAAEELGVKEEVSYFATPMPYDPVRTTNLQVGTKKINGVLVKPGETFSLLEHLRPITAAEGYTSSGVVVSGNATTAIGGGLSQLSTTMFNAGFEAGMTDVTHQPHSRWFTRYPEGREATIFDPSIDMQWKNNTPYGVLVQAWVGDSQTHVRLWSTKYWDVKISTGNRYNLTSPTTVYNTSGTCTPESGGAGGFSVNYTRTVSRNGEVNEADSRTYSHTYSPWHKIVCGPKPSPSQEPQADGED